MPLYNFWAADYFSSKTTKNVDGTRPKKAEAAEGRASIDCSLYCEWTWPDGAINQNAWTALRNSFGLLLAAQELLFIGQAPPRFFINLSDKYPPQDF